MKNWGPIKDWWNKDFKGALLIVGLVIVVGFLLFGCAVPLEYRPRIEAGFGIELDRDKPVMGRDPVGVARVNQTIWRHEPTKFELFGEYLHLSSVPDNDDLNTVDQLNLMFRLPLGKPAPASIPVCTPNGQ